MVPWVDIGLWTIFCVVPALFAPSIIACYVLVSDKEKVLFRRLSLVYYIYMWIYIIALILIATVTEVENVFEDTGLDFFFMIGIPITYLIVLFESINSSDYKGTDYTLDASETEEFLKKLRESLAVITFHGECYHTIRGPIRFAFKKLIQSSIPNKSNIQKRFFLGSVNFPNSWRGSHAS